MGLDKLWTQAPEMDHLQLSSLPLLMRSLTSLLGLNFAWPVGIVASWPFGEDGIQRQLLRRSQLTLHKPCPGPGPRFSLSDCQGGGSLGGASDQRRQ